MDHPQGEYPVLARRKEEEYRIYVNNLPDELDEDGITQLFKAYGNISSILWPPGAKYAFIGYKTYREAEQAIRALNERDPLNLKVSFSKNKSQKKEEKYLPPENNCGTDYPVRDCRYVAPLAIPTTPGRKMMSEAFVPLAHYPSFNHGLEPAHGTVYPCELDYNMYNPYETVGRYADTNAMWSRGCVNIDEAGRRYVSMGRGYTRYHIPEPPPKIEEMLSRVHEIRRAGFYQYGNDVLRSDISKCLYCGNMTKVRCERCNGFYCCRECQITDWPRHKSECRSIPDLVGDQEVTSLSRSSSEERLLVPRKPMGVDLRPPGPLRRPKRSATNENLKMHADVEAQCNETITTRPKPVVQETGVSSSKEVLNDIAKTNGMATETDSSQQISHKNPIRDNNQKEKQSNRYDHNSNDKYHNGSVKANCRTAIDQQNGHPPRDNGGINNCHPGKGSVHSNDASGYKKSRPVGSHASSFRDLSHEDILKIEQEISFQHDSRPQSIVGIRVSSNSETLKETALPRATEDVTIIEDSIPDGVLLSKDEFTSVIVVVDMPDGTFWIHRESDAADLGALMVELNDKVDNYPLVSEPVEGVTYAVKYCNLWHRAVVISTKPLGIFYTDYGNAEPPQSLEFRSLKDFPLYPPFAIRIRFVDNTKAKVDDQFEVKMINVDKDGIIEVVARQPMQEQITAKSAITETIVEAPKVEPAKVASPVIMTPTVAQVQPQIVVKLPSLIDSLSVNDQGWIQVYMALDEMSYAVCVLGSDFQPQFQLIYEQLSIECAQATKPPNFSPKIGDFVCGKRGTDWLRGYVFSVGPPIRLALVDEARISQVEEILPMPEKYSKLCSFGSICTFNAPGSTFEVDESAQFKVTGVKENAGDRVVNVTIVEPDRLKNVSVTLKNWKPTPEQKGIAFAELKPNTEVCITAYSSERIMFVRSLDVETLERTNRIMQDVAKWAQIAPKLDGPPAIGQLVIAKYADGNFYRAIVTKMLEDKISVSYVDYGNREVTTIDQLRSLSDELKGLRSCAAKVLLKDIKTDVPPTKKVHEYLDYLVGQELPLFCTFEGIPSKDGVILTTATGECVNTSVNELLTPSTEKKNAAADTKCFMLNDFEFAQLGEVGKVTQAIVLHATAPPFRYVMSPIDQEVISHVSVVMAEKIHEYCEATKEHYIPRIGELCLAIYFGQWYRGVCLEIHAATDQITVQFVDYGNVEAVEYKNIRAMTQEFFDVPGLGCICVVKNLGIELVKGAVPPNIMTRLNDLIQINNLIDIMIVGHKDMEYVVELPEVKKTLIAEGLVKL